MRQAISSGGVVLREIDGQLKIALAREEDKGPNAWVLPKGHVQAGETIEQAALREIAEEVGLQDVQLVTYLGKIERPSIEDSGEEVLKTIHIFLAYACSESKGTADVGQTHTPIMKWFSGPEAYGVIPFKEDREFLMDRVRPMMTC